VDFHEYEVFEPFAIVEITQVLLIVDAYAHVMCLCADGVACPSFAGYTCQ